MIVETARGVYYNEDYTLNKYMTVKFWKGDTLSNFKLFTIAVEDMCAFIGAELTPSYIERKTVIETVLGWREEGESDVKT